MTHLPRPSKLAIILATLVTLIALPVVWTQQAPWHGIAPALSHAGGSPDETLKPQPVPPGSSTGRCAVVPRRSVEVNASALRTVTNPGPAYHVRTQSPAWLLYGRLYLTALLRF